MGTSETGQTLALDEPLDLAASLSELELFSGCPAAAIDRLVGLLGDEVRFEPDDVLVGEGDTADHCLVILDGEAHVTVGGRYVGTVGAGDAVGEMGLLDRAPRMANVTAETPVTARRLDGRDFDQVLVDTPTFALALLRQVSGRLRALGTRAPGGATAPADDVESGAAAPDPVTGVIDLTTAPSLDPFAPGFFDDPYPQFAAVRDAGPMKAPDIDAWVITRYADVQPLIRSSGLLSVRLQDAPPSMLADLERERLERSGGVGAGAVALLDPPEHTRIRRLVQPAFTPKAVARARERATELLVDRLEELRDHPQIDFVADIAFPLPFTVISELVGMPPADEDLVRQRSGEVLNMFDPFSTPEMLAAADEAAAWMTDYCTAVIEEKRRNPADDLMSAFIAAEEDGDRLSTQELVELIIALYIAGHETTVHLLGNGLFELLSHRDQWDRLCAEPELVPNAVEEVLRYQSPSMMMRRVALVDLPVGEVVVPAGDVLLLGLAPSNRDPDQWGPTADQFDITREGAHQHLSFGGGVHHCFGSSLARMEAQVAFTELTRLVPDIELVDEKPKWRETMVIRGLAELPVVLHP